MEAATEDPVGRGTKEDWQREESIQYPRPVRRRTMHKTDPGFLANDGGGGEGGAARAATGTDERRRGAGEGVRDKGG